MNYILYIFHISYSLILLLLSQEQKILYDQFNKIKLKPNSKPNKLTMSPVESDDN